MDRGNIFSGGAFRVTLYATLVLIAVCTITAVFGYRYIQEAQLAQLRDRLQFVTEALEETYDQSGSDALIQEIETVGNRIVRDGQIVSLINQSGEWIAGSHLNGTDFANTAKRKLTLGSGTGDTAEYYLTKSVIGPYVLLTGANLGPVRSVELVFIRSLMLIAAFLTLVFITLGYLTSRGIQAKLELIDATLGKFANGEVSIRLPVSTSNDQVDRVSNKINRQLDHLSGLMAETKSSATAIAHDLKRPLGRAMLGVERALADADQGIAEPATLEQVQSELTNLNRIFETILRISHVDTGHGERQLEKVDLVALTADLAETFAVVAEEHSQSLHLSQPAGEPIVVNGDAGMIVQMLANLLQNAITHGPRGNCITLSVKNDGRGPVVEVADTGPGIPEQDHARVFDAFYRAEASRSTAGNGLGMTLAKSIAERHGAIITLAANAPGLRVLVRFPEF
ncbi:MAG: HAMP domain-containing sensor histidine kinase [Sulfitobacter sp.]